jgi:hypothetical protein
MKQQSFGMNVNAPNKAQGVANLPTTGATKMQMSAGPSSSNMGGSKGLIFKSNFTAPSTKLSAPKAPSMSLGVKSMSMSMGNKFSNPSAQVNQSMNQMKTFGFSAGAQAAKNQARSSVVMEAGPVVTGETGEMDMQFFDRKFNFSTTNNKFADELITNAKKLGGTAGKGILATDESNYTIGIRFEGVGVESTLENRTQFRSMLYRDPSVGEYFSGAIMFDETARATDTVSGKTNIQLINDAGMLPGIKIDIGLKEIPGTFGEVATQGLDNLPEKAAEYYEMGIRFAKWRAVIKIDEANGCPSNQHIMEIAHSLARYGACCQHAGLVPIIEPEVLMDGAHSIETCYKWSDIVLQKVVE